MSIELFCDGHRDRTGQATHEPWTITRWKRIDGQWTATKRRSAPGEPLRLFKGRVDQLLHGEEPLTDFSEWREDARARYRLECPQCGLAPVALKPTLITLLEALDAAGVSSISLAALDARLAKNAQPGNSS